MPSTAFDSFYFKDRFGTAAMRALWNDRATLQRWLDVEAALAEVEAELGLIPEPAAREIRARARLEGLDLRSMKRAFDLTWNPVVPLVDALRKKLSPQAAGYLHWGATSKNIFDTGLALQLKDSCDAVEGGLWRIADQIAELAAAHRSTIMAGRTHGQHALPVTFGFRAAVWLDELLRHEERLRQMRSRALVGEFGGAVGTLAALGRKGDKVQKALMRRLGLGVATVPVKTAGDRVSELVLGMCLLSASLGKIAQNIYNLQQTDVDEVTESTEGKIGSSAMPHKQNPVASGSVVYLGRLLRANAGPALDYVLAEGEDDHRQGETAWKFVPEVFLLLDAQMHLEERLLKSLIVKPENMLRNLERAGGFVCSEALVMRLGSAIGRDHAHALVKTLSDRARDGKKSLAEVVAEDALVLEHLTPKQIARVLDPHFYLGETDRMIGRTLTSYRKRRESYVEAGAL